MLPQERINKVDIVLDEKLSFKTLECQALTRAIQNAILSYICHRLECSMPFEVDYETEKKRFHRSGDHKRFKLRKYRQTDLIKIDDLLIAGNKADISALELSFTVFEYLKYIKVGFKLFWFIQIGTKSYLRDHVYDAIKVFDPKIFSLCESLNIEKTRLFNSNRQMHQYWHNVKTQFLSSLTTASTTVSANESKLQPTRERKLSARSSERLKALVENSKKCVEDLDQVDDGTSEMQLLLSGKKVN